MSSNMERLEEKAAIYYRVLSAVTEKGLRRSIIQSSETYTLSPQRRLTLTRRILKSESEPNKEHEHRSNRNRTQEQEMERQTLTSSRLPRACICLRPALLVAQDQEQPIRSLWTDGFYAPAGERFVWFLETIRRDRVNAEIDQQRPQGGRQLEEAAVWGTPCPWCGDACLFSIGRWTFAPDVVSRLSRWRC